MSNRINNYINIPTSPRLSARKRSPSQSTVDLNDDNNKNFFNSLNLPFPILTSTPQPENIESGVEEIYKALKNIQNSWPQTDVQNLLTCISNENPLKVHEAIKKLINESIKDDFGILFHNEYVIDKIAQDATLKNYVAEQIKIEFNHTPLGKLLLDVNKNKSYDIKLDDETLEIIKTKFKNYTDMDNQEYFNNMKDIGNLVQELNNMFGLEKYKDLDNVSVTYVLKDDGNDTIKEIKCDVRKLGEMSKTVKIFISTLCSLGIIGGTVLAALAYGLIGLFIGSIIFFQWLIVMVFFMGISEGDSGKLEGLSKALPQDNQKILAPIYYSILSQPREINYFASESFNNLTHKEKYQLFKQWNNNFKNNMQKYFKIEERSTLNNCLQSQTNIKPIKV